MLRHNKASKQDGSGKTDCQIIAGRWALSTWEVL